MPTKDLAPFYIHITCPTKPSFKPKEQRVVINGICSRFTAVISGSILGPLLIIFVHIIGHIGDGFYGPNDQTNSVKALKEVSQSREVQVQSLRQVTDSTSFLVFQCCSRSR